MIKRELIEKAESGNVEAIIDLGAAYYNGEDGEENRGKAFELFTKALELDPQNPVAINKLGNCYSDGVGVEENVEKAMELYRKAAEMGYANAQWNLADGLKAQKNPECLEWYHKAAENGATDAFYNIAIIYRKGEIVSTDYEKYIEYLMKATANENGNAGALLDLGYEYMHGEHVAEDKKKGVELTLKAANAGDSTAAHNMSVNYWKGDGVEVDIEKSVEWAKKAAELGDGSGLAWIAEQYFHGNDPITEDKAKAVEFFILAANAGETSAMEDLGVCYNKGYGVAVDKNKAIEWFEKAAKEGGSGKALSNLEDLYAEVDADTSATRYFELLKAVADKGYYEAMGRIHLCYLYGYGTEKNTEKAMQYLDQAVEGEEPTSCFLKGRYLYNGEFGLEQDRKKAVQLWEIAANKDHSKAAENLGKCYRDGDGVEVDAAKALEWFEKARALGNMSACLQLGFAYTGGFADTDYAKAARYYMEAYKSDSETISAAAAAMLAEMYEKGLGTEPNAKKAFELYKYAAEHDYANAQYKVYEAYWNGIVVQKDVEKAEQWLKKAADGGLTLAQGLIGFYARGREDGPTVVHYWEKASAAGEATIMGKLAKLYLSGACGVPMNKARAIELYKKAAELGDIEAIGALGICYANGNGVVQNSNEAFRLFSIAAEQGDKFAQKNLGICYIDGVGTSVNKAIAVQWLEKASAQGEIQAKYLLAQMYEEGEGTAVNYSKAEKLYNEVIDEGSSDYYEGAVFKLAFIYATKIEDHYRAFPLWHQLASSENVSDLTTKAKYNLGLYYYNGWGTSQSNDKALYWWRKAADVGHPDAEANANALKAKMQEDARSYQAAASKKSGGCYVATAVYGSYDCPEVWTLRRYRDYTLAETWYGRAFIKLYYTVSPTLVRWFGQTAWFKKMWKGKLDRMVDRLQKKGVESTPYKDRQF